MTIEKTDFITIDNLKLHQRIAGEGDPLVMLHGWGANVDLLAPLGERLSQIGYRVYMWDMPGFGASDEPPQAWGVFDYAELVVRYLDAHNLERTHLFGHSFGGRLSLILGAEFPQRINKIVLSNSAGLRAPTPLLPTLRLRSYKAVRDTLYAIGAKSLADSLRERYNARYGSSDFNQVSGVMRETLVKVINQDLSAYASRVQASTLLFWGDNDTETPLWMGEKLEQIMPDAGLVVHKGAGHYAYLDNLAETARVMDYFFKQVDE